MNALISKTPQASVVTASRSLVDKLLSMNTRNRQIKKSHIEKLVRDIAAGEFLLTASGIGVSCDGVLLDGQHRLLAIRQAGYPPVQFILVTGLAAASQRVVDRHTRRTLGDALTLHMNKTISGNMVAIANALHDLDAVRGKDEPFKHVRTNVADSVIASFMAEHNELCADVAQACPARAPIMAAIFVYASNDRNGALRFARDVYKGVELKEDSPAYRLRGAIDRLRRATDAAGRLELFCCAASACIADAQKRPMQMLRPVSSWATAPWRWEISHSGLFGEPSDDCVDPAPVAEPHGY
jgi:hypothetical protein